MTTVLIVDDEIDMLMLVRIAIEMANKDLEIAGEATNGTDALKVWREMNGPPTPDVVILDNRMPGLSGMEVAQQILAERPDQIIVLYSAYLDANVRREANELGIARCVTKDDVDKLASIVRELAAA
jgi:two-component system, chemotaxis family, chemotaxis protein CheY